MVVPDVCIRIEQLVEDGPPGGFLAGLDLGVDGVALGTSALRSVSVQ
jgi:hypothetical protein